MKNDQWFEPGDKVMRVSDSTSEPDAPSSGAPKGETLCVSHFIEDPVWNAVAFIGHPPYVDSEGIEWWDAASDFRKVEEIKLCVAAAEKAKQPSLQPV